MKNYISNLHTVPGANVRRYRRTHKNNNYTNKPTEKNQFRISWQVNWVRARISFRYFSSICRYCISTQNGFISCLCMHLKFACQMHEQMVLQWCWCFGVAWTQCPFISVSYHSRNEPSDPSITVQRQKNVWQARDNCHVLALHVQIVFQLFQRSLTLFRISGLRQLWAQFAVNFVVVAMQWF